MGRTLYGYADKIWEVNRKFEYTGEPEQFTLDPGRYLFICNGAAGGGTDVTRHWGFGATAYGVFETDQTETLYAVVGGNGKAYSQGIAGHPTSGGFNGGGAGGYNTNSSSTSGGSGGGGTDIRLTLDETLVPPVYRYNLPSDFLELEDVHLQWIEQAYINTGYYTTPNTRIETTMRFHSRSHERRQSWQIPFGTRTRDNGPDEMWMAVRNGSNFKACGKICGETIYDENNLFPFDEKVDIIYDTLHKYTSWVSESGKSKTITFTNTISQATSTHPLFIFTLNHTGSPGDYVPFGMRLYDFKIYEQDPNDETNDTLVHHYVPAQRKSDNMYGVYDLIDQVFIAYTPRLSGHRMFGTPYPSNSRTLLSRILVAGGGGGDAVHITYGFPICAYGGGKTAGFIVLRQGGDYSHTDCLPASQDEGYAFGKGEDGWRKELTPSYGADGAGGGGGGWFGGYTEAYYNASYSSIGGSGGSSYALTADSWKPYGYIPTSHYYLQNTALVGCQTTEGSILICTEVKLLTNEDVIIIPFTGKEDKMTLFPGKYRLKCYGGEGGITYENGTSIARYQGGYSEGVLNLSDLTDVYGVVGGAGLFRRGHTASSKFAILNELASFNGGGDTVTAPLSWYHIPWNGGGGTDIRLTMDQTPVHEPVPDPDTRDDIPAGYTQMKSTFTNGGNPFESGVIVTSDTEFIYDFKIDPGVSGSYPTVFGSDDGANSHSFVLFAWNDGTGHLALDGGGIDIGHLPKGNRLVLETKLSETMITVIIHDKDEGADYTYTGNRSLFVGTTKGLTFNCLNRGGYQNHINNTTYGIKFKVNGVVTHDFVPIKRDFDGTVGLYDIVGESFKTYNYTATATALQTVTYPSKTLLSRFIVAGGAGGFGYNSGYPGKGGGTTGGTIQNGNGENNGPGTQASSPQSTNYPGISGGFGYGGKGYVASGGRGGAGGGGWFGGSGTYPNGSSDNDKAGAGGSGYILTENSWKPDYYIPDEEFYLENGITTLGGNTSLIPNVSKIEIEVIEANCFKQIIHDREGYKAFDREAERWSVIPYTEITPAVIEEYGVYAIRNLRGVQDKFDILIDDPMDLVSYGEVTAFPLPQNITFLIPKRYKINRTVYDVVYDETVYSFSTHVSIYDEENNAYTLTIDKLQDVDSLLKLYSIQLFSQ